MNMQKRIQWRLLFSGLALGAVALAAPRAKACSCTPLAPPTEVLAKAAAVFEGSVVSVAAGAGPTIFSSDVKFRVLRSWKGVHADAVVTIAVPAGGSAGCGFDTIAAGSTWFVYANEFEGALTTSLCSGTRLSEYAASDVAELGPPSETSTAGGSNAGAGANGAGAPGLGSNGGGCALAGTRPWQGTALVSGALALLVVLGRRRRA